MMPSSSTKNRLLDCAETLFARDGYHSTSLRLLTEQAKANLAAVNYHFGSKENLLHAVIERHLTPLNAERRTRLEEVMRCSREQSQRPAVANLLRAFIQPPLEFRSTNPAAREFLTLVGRSWNDPDQTVRRCVVSLGLPIFQYFSECLRQALPDLPQPVLQTRLQFLIGAMSAVMCDNQESFDQDGILSSPLAEKEKQAQLLKFLRAGLEAPQ